MFNTVFTILFAIEMVLKLIGLGIKGYLKDGFNDFDGVIVLVSLVEFTKLVDASGITVLRAFRLLRIFKLIRSWGTLKKLLQTVIKSFGAIANLGLLMFLLVFIFSLVGMQFFNGHLVTLKGERSRYNFNTFGWSLITIFIILTGENWNEIMYIVINKKGLGTSLYFIALMIFGNFMVLNLFLAILLKYISDDVADEDKDPEEIVEEESVVEEELDLIHNLLKSRNKAPGIQAQDENDGVMPDDVDIDLDKEEEEEEEEDENEI